MFEIQLRVKNHCTGKIRTKILLHAAYTKGNADEAPVSLSSQLTKLKPDQILLVCHGQRTYVFLWESEAENGLTRSLCLTLLRGHKGLWGGPLLLLYPCGRGAVTHRGLSSHPCKHFYKHMGASSETYRCTQTQTEVGHTRLGRTVWRNATVWKGLMASEKGKQGGIKRGRVQRGRGGVGEWMKRGKWS